MIKLNLRLLLQDFSGEEEKEEETVLEIQLLVQCLTIICRHFDNITTIIKSSYISNCVALINSIIDKVNTEPKKLYIIKHHASPLNCFNKKNSGGAWCSTTFKVTNSNPLSAKPSTIAKLRAPAVHKMLQLLPASTVRPILNLEELPPGGCGQLRQTGLQNLAPSSRDRAIHLRLLPGEGHLQTSRCWQRALSHTGSRDCWFTGRDFGLVSFFGGGKTHLHHLSCSSGLSFL